MVRPKTSSKKPQKRGVDFKKYKRKLGRKLPPPKNATNTEIKSKAIILPEQSVASERVGLAVSKKGLTLKELLQQSSHHNAKVRRDALIGIRDLASKNPSELKLHKLVIIEKLRERISDDDKLVRETLYQLFRSVIFPGCKEEIPGPIISLVMAYIFNAMTHLSFDIRLMAFQFFELVVQHYPSSFLLYAEKILQNYEDILRKSHSYLQDKEKLKNALVGLVRCLSLLPSDGAKTTSSYEMITEAHDALHAFEPEVPTEHTGVSSIVNKLEDLMPVLVNCFQELTPSVVEKPLKESPSFDCMLSVLQSIDLALKYFVYGSIKYQKDSEGLVSGTYKTTDVEVWARTMLPNLLKKLLEVFPLGSVNNSTEKNEERYYVLNVAIAEIFLNLNDWIGSIISTEKVLEFVENALCGKICCSTWSSKSVREKHLVPLLAFIPKLVLQADNISKDCVLKAFTKAFKDCKPESSLKLACLSAIEEMLLPPNRYDTHLFDASDPEITGFQIEWIRELPALLVQLGDRFPSSSKIVLHLHLRLGQHIPMSSILASEYDKTQDSFVEFYCTFRDESNVEGGIRYGPFIMLPKDCQELAICSLYYFSRWDRLLLKSVTYCCLCHNLSRDVIFRIIEVLQLSYKAGHIQIADQISFLVTLLARFRAYPEKSGPVVEKTVNNSSRITLKAITSTVCSCLFQMGDNTVVFQILQKVILHEMSQKPPLDNMCAMLRTLASLDSRPTLLSDQDIVRLGNSIVGYMVDSAYSSPENIPECTDHGQKRLCRYYFIPCFVLFYKSDKLLNRVLSLMGSLVAETRKAHASDDGDGYSLNWSNRIKAVNSILLFMHKDVKMQQSLSCVKGEVRHILQELFLLQSSNKMNSSLEERHNVEVAFDELKTVTGRLHCWSADDLKRN